MLPDLQDRLAAGRPGAMTRTARWWRRAIDPAGPAAGEYKAIAVHTGPDGDDTIAIRSMMYLSLTYDHRLVDGADAGRFLQTLKARLEGGAFEAELGL